MTAAECSSTYSDDEFELSLSPASSVFYSVDVDDDIGAEGPLKSDGEESKDGRQQTEEQPEAATSSHGNGDGGVSEAEYSLPGISDAENETEEDALLPVRSPSPCIMVGERDGRTAKQV